MTTDRITPPSPSFARSDELLALFAQAFDGFALWEADPWRVAYANQAFWQLISDWAEAGRAKPGSNDQPAGLGVRMVDELNRFKNQGVETSTVTICPGAGSDCKPVEVRLCRVVRGDKLLFGVIVRPNVSELLETQHSSDIVRRDPLTGLLDREFLMKRLATLLDGERLADRQFAVVFLDLDNFKQVNDEFGHLIGDNVLREAARRIVGCLREGDHVVRYGGDEFVVLVEHITSAQEVEPVIGRIHMALAKPIATPGGEVSLTLSAGMALASEARYSPEELLAAADRAMYAAKRAAV